MKTGPGLAIAALAVVVVATAADARRHGPPHVAAHSRRAPAAALDPRRAPALENATRTQAAVSRRTGFATASDGVRLYYEVCGHGPAIAFLHGLGGNHAVWFQQVADFAVDHTVVTMSQRGFAPSGDAISGYDTNQLARDLEAVMDAASIPRAIVVGQSMGGWTALRFALSFPERIEALVLADTTAGIHDEVIGAHLAKMVDSASRLKSAPPPLASHPALSPAFSRAEPALAILYQTLTTFGSPSPATIAGQLAATRVTTSGLRALRTRTLFVVGSDDTVFPAIIVARAASQVSGSRVAIVEGAGHSPYFEKPAAFNAALRRFFEEARDGAGQSSR